MENASTNHHNGIGDRGGGRRDADDDVSPLEHQVLAEYARLAANMDKLSNTLTLLNISTANSSSSPFLRARTTTTPNTTTRLSSPPPRTDPKALILTDSIAESLRLLERKVASVYTLMKASVYSIVLQQGDVMESDGEESTMRVRDRDRDGGEGEEEEVGGSGGWHD